MTRQIFPGDVIPKNRWDPLFPALLALYPAPINTAIVNNYYFSAADRNDWNNYDFKGDENFNDNNRLSVRYSRRDKDQYQNGPLPLPADGGLATTTMINSNSVVGSYVRILSPTMNNELRVGQSRMPSAFDIPYDKPLFDQYGIKGIPKTTYPSSNDHGLTLFAPSGYAQLGSRAFWPNTNNSYVTQFNDVLFRSAGQPRPQGGRRVQARKHLPRSRPLCARPDDLQPRIYGRPAEPRRHRRRPRGVHARLAGGRQPRQRERREPDGELPRRFPAGRLESVVRVSR